MSATTINITKQADGTWQGSFTSTGTRTIVQVERQENAPLYLNISADDGQHNVIYQPPKDFKNQILLIDIAEGALVTIVSHSAVTKAQYIASELDYYTKAEVDELIRGIHQFEPIVVDVLPTASEDTMFKFYFVPKDDPETSNASNEYITVRYGTEGSYTYQWERIGDTTIDLSGYATLLYVDGKFIPIPSPLPAKEDGTVIERIVQDYDGNWYDGVVIGNQIWLKQNLKTTHYADGTALDSRTLPITSSSDPNYTTPYYFTTPPYDSENGGLFYNWHAITRGQASDNTPSGVQGIAPNGWHIPSADEFQAMITYASSKYSATSYQIFCSEYFKDGNSTGNNLSGFDAVDTRALIGSGIAPIDITIFATSSIGQSEHVYEEQMAPSNAITGVLANGTKAGAYSVRCVCDITAEQWFNSHYLKNTSNGLVWAPIAKVAETNSYNDLDNKPTIGTAAGKNVPASGNASNTEVVLGNDTRLSDARNAADVYSWAKAQSKPSYDYSEIQNTPTLPTSAQLLPTVTSSDNGKILIVDNGAWAATTVPVADNTLF